MAAMRRTIKKTFMVKTNLFVQKGCYTKIGLCYSIHTLTRDYEISHHRSAGYGPPTFTGCPISGVASDNPFSAAPAAFAAAISRFIGSSQGCNANVNLPQCTGISAAARRSSAACTVCSGIIWIYGQCFPYWPHSRIASSNGPQRSPISLKCASYPESPPRYSECPLPFTTNDDHSVPPRLKVLPEKCLAGPAVKV